MQNPALAPTAYEVATAQELGISQHDLRNLGAKAAGINYQFADILKTATGVPLSPENVKLLNNMSQTQRRDWLLMNTGGQPRFRKGTIFYRGGNIGGDPGCDCHGAGGGGGGSNHVSGVATSSRTQAGNYGTVAESSHPFRNNAGNRNGGTGRIVIGYDIQS